MVRDAYRSLADTFRATADAGSGPPGPARALRLWALEDPQRYFLVHGTPVPGYRAPDDITAIAQEIMAALLDVCEAEEPGTAQPDQFETHLADHRRWAGDHPAPTPVLRRALAFWTRRHGALSLALAGHLTDMGFDPELLFTAEVDGLTGGR
ncbi:TetR-like C-terminal domain-containing protein [Streptomyces sp. NPDC101151]|uniref:TetR-like C-terminal domain-containing protein n=1 Tax=Streptomyces sp. NPDC101151 TaxID=3366115 RepID=UPI00381CD7C1